MVIYKSSDVVYDLAHNACSSMQSPRLRYHQVGWLSPFDYEERSQYSNLLLTVTDNGRTPRRSTPTPITVRIVNLNDENPVFDQPTYSKSTHTLTRG